MRAIAIRPAHNRCRCNHVSRVASSSALSPLTDRRTAPEAAVSNPRGTDRPKAAALALAFACKTDSADGLGAAVAALSVGADGGAAVAEGRGASRTMGRRRAAVARAHDSRSEKSSGPLCIVDIAFLVGCSGPR